MDRHVFYCHAPHNADLTFSIGPEINDITYIARSASYIAIEIDSKIRLRTREMISIFPIFYLYVATRHSSNTMYM